MINVILYQELKSVQKFVDVVTKCKKGPCFVSSCVLHAYTSKCLYAINYVPQLF